MLKFIILSLFSFSLYAQEEASSKPSLYLIEDIKKTNLIQLEKENQENVFVAIPRNASKLNVAVQSKEGSFLILIDNKESNIDINFYNYGGVHYGGRVELGTKFGFNGDVFLRRNQGTILINHNHEYAFYKINIQRYTIEPVAHQYFRFFQLPIVDQKKYELFVQPSNLGLRLGTKKPKVNGYLLLSVGPQYNLITTDPTMKKVIPSFNLKLAITF